MRADERPNILLVDDVPQNLLALEAVLEPLGCNLVGATSGEEALRALLKDDFALVLLDVQMPELDGFETAALIKQRERTRNIPIIFLTAVSKDSKQIFRGYSGGAVDYILKPFDPELLRSKVAVFVDLHQKTEQLKRQAELLRKNRARRGAPPQRSALPPAGGRDAADRLDGRLRSAGRPTATERFYEYTGLDPEKLAGDAWVRDRPPGRPGGGVEERAARARDRRGLRGAVPLPRRRRLVPLASRTSDPDQGAAGRVDLWVGTATDIDDQKRAVPKIEEQAQAARVLTAIADAVFLIDRSGVVRLWNPAAEAATGLTADDVCGFRSTRCFPAGPRIADKVPVASDPKELSGTRRSPRGRREGAVDLRRRRRRPGRNRLRVQGHDRGAVARADATGPGRDGLPRAANAARRDLRLGGDHPPQRHRARRRPP